MCTPQFSIAEEQEPGILVGSLSEHFPPPYQLLTQEYLWLDSSTGHLYTTAQKMDREAICPDETKAKECIILHNAVVGPTGDIIRFPVIVADINDNAPHFENAEIHLRVSEDVSVGTSFLLDEQASDRDVGRNGELRYHVEGASDVFNLKLEKGHFIFLVVRAALDRETEDQYQMTLVVTDCGLNTLSATATVIVTVTDVNDNCPSFHSDSPFNVTIPGDAQKNMLVAQVRATDPDSGLNAAIIYSLSPKVSERAKELFSLDSLTGYIRLAQDLHSDNSEELMLKVLAHGRHCPPAVSQVTVSVIARTQKELTMRIGFIAQHQNQTIVLLENQPPTVLAVLQLEGDSSYQGMSLTIEGEVPFSLRLQDSKYLLSTSGPLDFEMKSEHNISIVVHRRSATGTAVAPPHHVIKVVVVDVNDNAPRFSQSHYQLEVEENNHPGMSLLRVSAPDADSGHNGRVTYRLDPPVSTVFDIDPLTGQMSVSASLDREQQCVHTLTVLARDSGSPPLESVAKISIRVLDKNDNAPVFFTPHFIFFIHENAPQFSQVGRVGVTDPDEGENGDTELHVVNNNGLFVVDNAQGTLRTTSSLDREKEDRYELYLLASDHGQTVSLTSTAKLTIFVEDVNDNQPKVILPNSNYSCLTVSPATAAGSLVMRVHATDADSGLNSDITYTVVAREPAHNSSPFRLDSRSGNISLVQNLVRKHLGMHHLLIAVSDGGKPAPLYTTIWVNLLVNDSMEPCELDNTHTWTPDFLPQAPSKAPICEVGESTTTSGQLTLLAGLGMLVFICFLVLTVVLYQKQQRRQQQRKREHDENEIPLQLKDGFFSDD